MTEPTPKPSGTPQRKLLLIAVDLSVPEGQDSHVQRLLTRYAQEIRHRVERGGVEVGEARATAIEDLSVEEFVAALASLRGRP